MEYELSAHHTDNLGSCPESKVNTDLQYTPTGRGIALLLLGQRLSRWVCQAVPVGGVCEQVGQDGTQQGEGDLLGVQAEDAVEQLHDAIGPLLSSLLQQLLKCV